LFNIDWQLRLTDFGETRFLKRRMSMGCGTPLYSSPEISSSTSYDTKTDCFSFALVMWECIFGPYFGPPGAGVDRLEYVDRVIAGYRPTTAIEGDDGLVARIAADKRATEFYQAVSTSASVGLEQPPGLASSAADAGRKNKLSIDQLMLLRRFVPILERCWHGEPEQRPDMDTVCAELVEFMHSAAYSHLFADGVRAPLPPSGVDQVDKLYPVPAVAVNPYSSPASSSPSSPLSASSPSASSSSSNSARRRAVSKGASSSLLISPSHRRKKRSVSMAASEHRVASVSPLSLSSHAVPAASSSKASRAAKRASRRMSRQVQRRDSHSQLDRTSSFLRAQYASVSYLIGIGRSAIPVEAGQEPWAVPPATRYSGGGDAASNGSSVGHRARADSAMPSIDAAAMGSNASLLLMARKSGASGFLQYTEGLSSLTPMPPTNRIAPTPSEVVDTSSSGGEHSESSSTSSASFSRSSSTNSVVTVLEDYEDDETCITGGASFNNVE
jgi:Protein kinase domain